MAPDAGVQAAPAVLHPRQVQSGRSVVAMSSRKSLARVPEIIGDAFVDGTWEASEMAARACHDLGIDSEQWVHEIAVTLVTAVPSRPSTTATVHRFVRAAFAQALERKGGKEIVERLGPAISEQSRRTAMGPTRWPVPRLNNSVELGRLLRCEPTELDWYADVKSLERFSTDENLRHYTYHWRRKARGGARLLEAPKQNLKFLQRQVLRTILDHIPAHDAAHGFRKQRSIQTFADGHTGREVVVRVDLRDFFSSVSAGRVFGIYHTAGYPDDVAHTLAGLATNTTPPQVLRERPSSDRFTWQHDSWLRGPHLAQGAPTSPALANLAAFGLDRRLAALARSFDSAYTRYADDLAFSGGEAFRRQVDHFIGVVGRIAADEGFVVNKKKLTVRTAGQRQVLAGLVVNERLNVHRGDFDQLRAVLHDAVHNGPDHANRRDHPHFRAHLEGRIGFVQSTNVSKARRLWKQFDQIQWDAHRDRHRAD